MNVITTAYGTRIPDAKDAALRDALAWVRHWKADVECGLKPTIDSLVMVEAKLVSALEAGR